MQYDYWKRTPILLKFVVLLLGILAIFPFANLIILGVNNLTPSLTTKLDLMELGQLGDFFGGHTSAFAGSLSLLVVLFFTFHQARQQAHFFQEQRSEEQLRTNRSFFLEGVGLITQWDIAAAGSDQCLRMLDYYGRIALGSTDRELLLILNTVITAKIRANLEGKNGSFKRTNYPYACKALDRIAELRKEDGLASRGK